MESRTPLEEALDGLLLRSLNGQDAQARRWAADAPGRAYSPPVLQSVAQQFAALFTLEEVKASINRLAQAGELRLETECSPDGHSTAIYLIPIGYAPEPSGGSTTSYAPSLPPGQPPVTIEQW